MLADGPSIREYIADTAAEYGVDEKIHYGLKVVGADWSSAESRWTVTTPCTRRPARPDTYTLRLPRSAAPATTTTTRATCRTSPARTGSTGRCVHPQHWPEDLDYAGKKVVVIGSGATAVTLVPAMAGDAAHVTMLQRSPSYIFSLPAFDKISRGPGPVPAGQVGVRARAQAQHRDPARAVPGVPALAALDAPIPALAGATPPRPVRST